MSEKVNHPLHYQGGGIECIDAMLAAFGKEEVSSFCKLNAFKYIWRSLKKDSVIEDIKKALWYLNTFIQLNDGKQ
jgi:hypothetical protein